MLLEADYSSAVTVNLSDADGELEITQSGTYIVTGSCSDGGITVKKGVTGVVLVLSDLDLTSTSGAPVSVNKNAEAQIIISGSVTLTDAENPEDETSTDETVADAFDGAAIKIKAGASVYLTGSGRLIINGEAKNGIKAGDEASLVIDGLTLDISAANDAINANYDLAILGGTVSVSAGDDAIHADRILTIGNAETGAGPAISVTESCEGLEGSVVNIFGGTVSVSSEDDGVNAANSDATYAAELSYSINILGGSLTVKSGGDGLDSNGNINLIAGSASVSSASSGGEAGIDYDGALYISDEFSLNNQSGMAGPDNMGGMPGGMGNMGSMGSMGGFSPMSGANAMFPGMGAMFPGMGRNI
jgi:hypothetical protein